MKVTDKFLRDVRIWGKTYVNSGWNESMQGDILIPNCREDLLDLGYNIDTTHWGHCEWDAVADAIAYIMETAGLRTDAGYIYP